MAIGAKRIAFSAKLAGAPEELKASVVMLMFDSEGMHLKKVLGKSLLDIPWARITDVAAEGSEELKERLTLTRVALLGPLSLGFKKRAKKQGAFLTVETNSGPYIFELEKTTSQQVRAQLAPIHRWMRPQAAD